MAENAPPTEEPAAAELQPVIDLYHEGRLESVLEQIDALLRKYRNSASLHNFHGVVCAGLERPAEAVASCRRAIELQPDAVDAHRNLVSVLFQTGDPCQAIDSLRQLSILLPDSADAHYNLAVTLQNCGELEAAIASYRRALTLNPEIAEAHNNLGLALFKSGQPEAALACYRRAIEKRADFAEAHHNMGVLLHETGALRAALQRFQQALALKPGLVDTHNHCGNVFTDLGDLPAARRCFQQALKIDPEFQDACWNLAGTADGMEQCVQWLQRCLEIDAHHVNAALLLAALRAAQGQYQSLRDLQNSKHGKHPFLRSFDWVFGLPRLPELIFNRWAFFDAVVKRCDSTRPFYEFGVWRGQSFRYLIRSFKRGFGFDTFSGLPEDWHEKHRGSYSSQGQIPDVEGGEFVVGEFERTLPAFFDRERPTAALINFDADLYSSTLCALEHARPVIDDRTILVFDEFIMNEHWEQDEFRALSEFCAAHDRHYEVLAVCFFSKQVAVRLV